MHPHPGCAKREQSMNWVVVETIHLHELSVSKGLQRKSISNLIPTYSREVRHARRTEVRRFPLFPRYLFAHVDLDDHHWKQIYTVRGVRSILGMPTPVTDAIVKALGGCIIDLKFGDRIRFRGGAYQGIEAIFKFRDGEKVTLEIKFMGKDVEVHALRGDIEKA